MQALALAAATLALSSFPPVSAAQDGERWTQAELESLSRSIQADLEQLRGEEFSRPVAVKVSSKEDLIAYIKARLDKTTPPEQLAADEMVAKMLAVVPHDMDMRASLFAMLEAQVGGYYDPDTDSFSLMEWLPRGVTKIVLAHELDHALDDQLFDIDGTLERIGQDTDAILAYHAVVEGSGTIVMMQWMLQHGDPSDLGALAASQMKDLTSMAGAPDWLWKPLMATYTAGSGFLGKTGAGMAGAGGDLDASAVRTAFTTPPASTEQVLHPEKYWNEGERDEPRKVRIDVSKLGKGWSLLREDTLGELMIAILATPPARRDATDFANPLAMMGLRFTNDVAAGWDGDRLVLLGKDEARILRWVTAWDGERDAGEFFGAMSQQVPAIEAAARGLAGEEADAGERGATVEYGEKRDEVVITVRVRTSRGELKRVLRDVKHASE